MPISYSPEIAHTFSCARAKKLLQKKGMAKSFLVESSRKRLPRSRMHSSGETLELALSEAEAATIVPKDEVEVKEEANSGGKQISWSFLNRHTYHPLRQKSYTDRYSKKTTSSLKAPLVGLPKQLAKANTRQTENLQIVKGLMLEWTTKPKQSFQYQTPAVNRNREPIGRCRSTCRYNWCKHITYFKSATPTSPQLIGQLLSWAVTSRGTGVLIRMECW